MNQVDNQGQHAPLEDFLRKPNQLFWLSQQNGLSSALSEIPKLEFSSLNQQQVQGCIEWVLEKSLHGSPTDAQGVYLCAVLGHLALTTSSTKRFELTAKSDTTARACDNLLRCLTPRSLKKKPGFISATCWKLLEAIAPVLADNSSTPGWLKFAADFYPIFGMEYLLQVKITSPKYEKENYMRLVRMLLQHVQKIRNAPREDKQFYEPFLKRTFKLAPDECTLFQLFADESLVRIFL